MSTEAQVKLRDTTIVWQHHAFELNDDGSIKTFTTQDDNIQEITFANAKIMENDLIKLVLVPEYGGRVLSFVYKPTDHEYLYISECGSAYGIYQDIFYYDWLMVYGGIFPTFPEAEHGKTWFLPWDFSVIEETDEKVVVRMEYTDDTEYSSAPWNYNNGITNLTCQVDIGMSKGSSIWDFDVKLINDKSIDVSYEYWTCTTLAPGSEHEDTRVPLNTEIIIPIEQYFAAWSPGAWIGQHDEIRDFEEINEFEEWENMGIAYALDFDDTYWGVINHDNEEGVFRVSQNEETKGIKLWSWGRNNIDNNLYDFSNEGADNYIELWAGVSEAFFDDDVITANSIKSWDEAYCATVNMSGICEMNNVAGVNLLWNRQESVLTYELNTFNSEEEYDAVLHIEANGVVQEVSNLATSFKALGHVVDVDLNDFALQSGTYTVFFDLVNKEGVIELSAFKEISINGENGVGEEEQEDIIVRFLGGDEVLVALGKSAIYDYRVLTTSGQTILKGEVYGKEKLLRIPGSGMYVISFQSKEGIYASKVFIP